MEIFYIFIIFFIGLACCSGFSNNKITTLDLQKIWIYHIVIAITYYLYTKDGGGDAWGYWRISKSISIEDFNNYILDKGTFALYAINYIPAGIFQMGFLSNTILYALFGFIGLTCFYRVCIELIPYNISYKGYYMFPILFFLPNLHFWCSGIGKDSLLFLCIGLISFGILNLKKRLPAILIGSVFSFIIRPHITLFLAISFGLAYMLNKKITKAQQIVFSVFLLAIIVLIFPTVMEYAKIEDTSLDSIESFSNSRTEGLSRAHTGSSIDISFYPYPLKILTFLYRPFFFDINGIPAIIASFENLLLLVLSIVVLKNKPIQTFKAAPLTIQGLLIFLFVGTLAFSMSLGNLGIMLRMRNMFLPGMIIFILWSFSYRHQVALANKKNKNEK